MKPHFLPILLSLSFFTIPAQAAESGKLLAGVAKTDITPKPGLRLWGYGDRTAPATGTLDPLQARAVVLKARGQAVAIVSLDLGRTPTEPLLHKLRKQTADKCGISQLFITASHTHAAPAVELPDYGAHVIAAIEKIVAEAAGDLVPVRLGVGRGQADFAHNRRKYNPDGTVTMMWRNADKKPTKPVDREFGVIRLDRSDGTPLAVLFNYACHPVVLGPDNLEHSADYVGAACRTVEEKLNTTCLFLQGACGDINPHMDKTPIKEGGVKEMRRMGEELGGLVLGTAKKIETAATPASLKFQQRYFSVPLRFELPHYLDASAAQAGIVDLALTTLLINDKLALVGMPGEVFVQFQMDLKARSPIRDTFLVGYCNGYYAYFPTIRDAAAGGYGGATATFVAVGTGERLLDDSIITLYQMTGKLKEGRKAKPVPVKPTIE